MSSIDRSFYKRLIEVLVNARKSARVSQQQLGALIGQRQTFVSKFETFERRLDVGEFIVVCRALGVDPYTLMKSAESDFKGKGD